MVTCNWRAEDTPDVFAIADEDLGYTELVKHEIPLNDDLPVSQSYRHIPPNQLQEVKDHISALLKKHVIQESSSSYTSLVVLDYRKLNCKTRRDSFPNSKMFSSIDLMTGYHQVAVHEKDRHKPAFITPFGLYDLCNVPVTLQRLVLV
ncbi:hypothetical protein M9458_015833, partial [Cirrhinus mrigala]